MTFQGAIKSILEDYKWFQMRATVSPPDPTRLRIVNGQRDPSKPPRSGDDEAGEVERRIIRVAQMVRNLRRKTEDKTYRPSGKECREIVMSERGVSSKKLAIRYEIPLKDVERARLDCGFDPEFGEDRLLTEPVRETLKRMQND